MNSRSLGQAVELLSGHAVASVACGEFHTAPCKELVSLVSPDLDSDLPLLKSLFPQAFTGACCELKLPGGPRPQAECIHKLNTAASTQPNVHHARFDSPAPKACVLQSAPHATFHLLWQCLRWSSF